MDITKHTEVLYIDVSQLIDSSKQKLAIAINSELPMLYWQVGTHIKAFILHGERAAYGQQIIINLSKRLTLRYGKGWSANSFDIVSALRRLFLKIKLSPHCGDN